MQTSLFGEVDFETWLKQILVLFNIVTISQRITLNIYIDKTIIRWRK